MSSTNHSADNFLARLPDKSIYIVGPIKLQNVLMAFFLDQATGAKCMTVEHFGDIPAIDNENIGQQKLALWDCLGRNLVNCLLGLEMNGERISSQHFLGLFNIRPGLGIEKETLARGVRGFFYEEDPLDRFTKGIHTIFNGELWVSRKIMTECILKVNDRHSLLERDKMKLTHRENQILNMVATGATNEEVADRLFVSRHTVKTHLYRVYKKINVPSRLQAALWATKNL